MSLLILVWRIRNVAWFRFGMLKKPVADGNREIPIRPVLTQLYFSILDFFSYLFIFLFLFLSLVLFYLMTRTLNVNHETIDSFHELTWEKHVF